VAHICHALRHCEAFRPKQSIFYFYKKAGLLRHHPVAVGVGLTPRNDGARGKRCVKRTLTRARKTRKQLLLAIVIISGDKDLLVIQKELQDKLANAILAGRITTGRK